MAKNPGKIFEDCIKESVPETCWIYRLRDNASSFAGGDKTRFASSNICDFIAYDDISRTLFLWELKSTSGTSVPLSMIRKNQVEGLVKASEHDLVAGFIINFRNENNDTFFIYIENFIEMIQNLNKKSFNINDLENNEAIKIDNKKKRTRYVYDIKKLIDNSHL